MVCVCVCVCVWVGVWVGGWVCGGGIHEQVCVLHSYPHELRLHIAPAHRRTINVHQAVSAPPSPLPHPHPTPTLARLPLLRSLS